MKRLKNKLARPRSFGCQSVLSIFGGKSIPRNGLNAHKFGRILMHLVAGLVALLAPFAAFAQGQQETEEPQVVIWRTLRNDFHDPAISPEFVAQVVDRTPSTMLTIGAGETVSSQLKKSFNISSTWTPQIYQRMVARVAELNSLSDINKVPASTVLLVPQVPTVGKKYDKVPIAWSGQTVKTALSWSQNSASEFEVSKVGPIGAAPQQEVQFFTVPLSEVSKYLLPGHHAQGASGPMKVNLSQGTPGTGANSVMSGVTANLVQSKLGASIGGVKPVVLVVDDSVPDSKEYAVSKAFVIELSKVIRNSYKLGDSPFLADLEAQPDSLAAESPDSLYPNLKTHASLIKQSLAEFTALDTAKRVSVVYIPLGATQIGVAPLLKEIVYLGQILKIVHPTFPPTITASQFQREQAKQAAEVIFKGNPMTFKSGLLSPVDGGELSVTTDSLLLESIGIAMSFFTDVTNQPYLLSFSWTSPKLTFPTYFEASTYGLKLAAAGNQKKQPTTTDFLQLELEYASRAATSQDFVVVMNSTGVAGGCPSNVFNDDGLFVASVAFPGNVTDKFCGTSFSTPRVAWLIAAREAAFGKRLIKPLSETAKLSWLSRQHGAVLALKQAAQADILGRYSLDIQKFFAQ